MNRMTCAEDGDTLPILQISSWGQAPLELSEFKEASISPARDILLLISHQRQALLLPLAADSTEQVIPDTYFSPSQPASPNDNIQNAFEQKFFTPLASRQKIPSIPRSASKSSYDGADSPSYTPFYTPFSTPLRNSSPLYETPSYESPSGNGEGSFCFPAIPDARSLAWGCFGDECGDAKDAGIFKQLLFVSGERGVTVHAFCRKQMTDVRQDAPSEADGGRHPKARNEVGRFVNWGPDGISLDGCFADVAHDVAGSFREEVGSTGGVGERDDGFYGERVGSTVPNMSSTSQKWLRSFFVDMELEESGGNLIAMFPAKSSIPSSAEVVSFCFSCNSPAFLHFIRSRGQASSHDKDDSKVTSASIRQDKLLATESVQPDSCLGSENFLLPNQLEQDSCNGVKSPYECSKLFSSPSHRLVGMVLTRQFCVSEAAEEGLSKSELELFVLVAVLHVSGIRWVSIVDLQNLASSRLPRDAWVEFQLADEVLFGLKESGIIFMWAALTGKLMGCIDVLYHCGLELDLHTFEEERIEQPKRVQEDEMEYTVTSGVKRESTSEGVGKLQNVQMSRKTSPVHGFRGLLVTANALLIAVTDKHGSVHVISTDEYFAGFQSLREKSASLSECFNCSDLNILSSWEVAGSDIAGQKPSSDIPNRHWFKSSADEKELLGGGNIEERTLNNNQVVKTMPGATQGFSNSSGFVSSSCKRDGISEVKRVQPLRRVFLPSERYESGAIISLSPYGITKLVHPVNLMSALKEFKIVQTPLHLPDIILEDRGLDSSHKFTWRGYTQKEKKIVGEVIGFCDQGFLYLVSKLALHVVLPPLSLSSSTTWSESQGRWWFTSTYATDVFTQYESVPSIDRKEAQCQQWQIEVLDRALVYDGLKEAEHLTSENGWSIKRTRLRWLQLALDYLRFDDVEQALEELVAVNAAEEGVLRVLFSALEQMISPFCSDNELAQASRLVVLAARFATKMVRHYGKLEWKRRNHLMQILNAQTENFMESMPFSNTMPRVLDISGKLCEMARFLEVIRNLQDRINRKRKRPNQGMREAIDEHWMVPSDVLQKSGQIPDSYEDIRKGGILTEVELMLDKETVGQDQADHNLLTSNGSDQLALSPLDSLVPTASYLASGSFKELSVRRLSDEGRSKQILPLENPEDMVRRWEVEQLDITSVVKDALRSGRLPLAVLQFHRLHSKETAKQKEPRDVFKEVQEVGKTIVYELFCKGKTALAIAALQRLGEDIEINLRELAFGTVSRFLRTEVTQELKRCNHFRSPDFKILERVSLLERLYPSSSFWSTYGARQRPLLVNSSDETLSMESKLRLICSSGPFRDLSIQCGEIDGVVIGSWSSISSKEDFVIIQAQDNPSAGYWAGAAIWLEAWDQRTMDRIILDQPFFMGVHISWEAQFEYYIAHNDWEEVSKLLDTIPPAVLQESMLHIELDFKDPTVIPSFRKENGDDYFCSHHSDQEVDAIELVLPKIKLLRVSVGHGCAQWMRKLIEEKLAKSFIFLQAYWHGTQEIMSLLARAGLICNISRKFLTIEVHKKFPDLELSDIESGEPHKDTVQAVHGLVLRFCVQYNLPNLLDIYLDHHSLAADNTSMPLMRAIVGGCQWAQWLLLSRIKGCEYDASFSNARLNISRNVTPGRNLGVPEIEGLITTVDDMAEGGELAALATLMYAPLPLQKCLCTGSVSRHRRTSSQCTIENLRPALQNFPTLWRSLLAVCFGQDACSIPASPSAKNVNLAVCKYGLYEYLNWREGLFSSAGGDTSLLQMMPRWFPKGVRRLLQLSVQGPVAGHTLAGNMTVAEAIAGWRTTLGPDVIGTDEDDVLSWEASLQKNIEEELYTSSFEEGEFGVEHHLHRGRALAAFKSLIGNRAQRLNLLGRTQDEQMGKSSRGQTQISAEVQMMLSPFTQSEEKLLISVMPLAITHFEENVLVASCAFLLELCGLSANLLRVDVASLRRISSFYQKPGRSEDSGLLKAKEYTHFSSSLENDVATSLSRTLADDYVNAGMSILVDRNTDSSLKGAANQRPSRALMAVLQHLEKASLPDAVNGQSCGLWLLTGEGDGSQLRAQQRAASEHWCLVTTFCQVHRLPISTMYLATLARDNDWVGFLAEAQLEGCPIELLISVAAKEFTDARLKSHILTVLKGMQSSRQKANSGSNLPLSLADLHFVGTSSPHTMMPTELFGLLAECEKQKHPGKSLLVKAKDLRWPLLAIIASCFPDVSALSCLTVWLEITAARETSLIKVNDIAARIATSVGAAVEATNALPNRSRVLSFRYNRKNPKRRRLMEHTSMDNALDSDIGSTTVSASSPSGTSYISSSQGPEVVEMEKKQSTECLLPGSDSNEEQVSLSKMVAVLCEQQLFLPLLKAFELFIPSCSLLPFIRFLQAFSKMRLSEASAHLASFSARLKEESQQALVASSKGNKIGATWIASAALKAADAMLTTCPSAYERRCLLQLLAAAEFGDGGSAAARFRRLYWKTQLAEPALRQGAGLLSDNANLDDGALLTALEKSGCWEEARSWARQLESSGQEWKSAVHHVTERQAEAMVAEWKEFLWDVPEEQAALWGHCQDLFKKYSFPPLQAGMFFLKHAEAIEKDVPALELHGMLLLALQWLSGSMTQSQPVYPLHLLREIETRVWLLAVESEAEMKNGKAIFQIPNVYLRSNQDCNIGNNASVIDHTASIIAIMDSHLNIIRARSTDQIDNKEISKSDNRNPHIVDISSTNVSGGGSKPKRRNRGHVLHKRAPLDSAERGQSDTEDNLLSSISPIRSNEHGGVFPSFEENIKIEAALAGWEERVGAAELERAVLSLLEVGQIAAAKQLQHKLSPTHVPSELLLIEEALKVAEISNPNMNGYVTLPMTECPAFALLQSLNVTENINMMTPLEVLEVIATKCCEGCGRGLCKRIIAVVKIANFLELSFSEAFQKQPIELLQLLSLKAQDSLEEAKLLVETHSMPAASIARILAESFLKGLLAAHRGGYMESSQREEGPAPLLWRASDFLKWAELCPSEPELGHALMRLVITGHDMPHACEVELLILAHHFYKTSACLDGVDVLVALAATRVESYVAEGDFSCLARLVTGVGNFHALYFMLDILIENGQLELLLQKYAVADATTESAEAIRGFRMAVLSALKHFNPDDLDAFAMVYNHFDMKHEMSALLESCAQKALDQWLQRRDKEQSEELLEMMRFYVEAAEVYSSIDAGNKARWSCAQASLVSLQIRMPDTMWLNRSETNARRALVEQCRFQEALIVAEAYNLNQSGEWVLVLWNQMLCPDLIDQFLNEFVSVLQLPSSMLMELARFYRAEVTARGDQSHFSTWLTPGGLPHEWARHLGKSFRSLLRQTRDVRLRIQLATVATGFPDVIDTCMQILDKVPDTAGPLILRKGHGGAYLPLM